jgi:hypothetical protein
MKRIVTEIALAAVALLVAPAGAQDIQQKLAAAKEAAARNQQPLRSYSWLEKTELRVEGRSQEHQG